MSDDADRPSSHYFDSSPVSASDRRTIRVDLPDHSFDMSTDAGVFSRHRLDPGTKILLQEAPPLPSEGTFLDLGCGAGAIALTMALRRPESTVWAVDVNDRARALCQENAHRLGITSIHVAEPQLVPESVSFDVIWSNPPIKVGKAALHAMLDHWLSRLSPHGRAVLVVHKNLGADSLAARLLEKGWGVERLKSRQGYRLLLVSAP